MEWFVRVLNRCLSFVAFVTAATLVIYMLIVIVTGTMDVGTLMLDTVFLPPGERQSVFNVLNGEFLHNVAVLLILMKAYRILVEYMRYHHIDLKYMVEIAVIACVLELLFNATAYSAQMQLLLGAIAVTFLAIYAFRYDTLVKAVSDTQDAVCNLNKAKAGAVPIPIPVAETPAPEPQPAPRKRATRKAAAKTTTRRTTRSK